MNEEIHKLKNTINQNIQILAHTQEKYKYVNEEANKKFKEFKKIESRVQIQKEVLKKKKEAHEKKSLKNYNEKKRVDDINSTNLIGYYKQSHKNIREYYLKILDTIKKLEKIRNPENMKDVVMQKKRADVLFHNEYSKLIVFEDNERVNN